MEEIFSVHAGFADRCVESLLPIERQCGALFLIDGRVVGFDLFDRALTLRRLLPKLVRSVAVDALDREMDGSPTHDYVEDPAMPMPKADRRKCARTVSPTLLTQIADDFLEKTCAADTHDAPAVGLGRDLRLVAPQISGAALNVNGSLVHLSAFQM
jgi:hypothetical protein